MKIYDEKSLVNIVRQGEPMSIPFCELKAGDHLQTVNGTALVCGTDAHVSGDADYEGWIVFDEYGEGYFPEDFGAPLRSEL